MGGRSLATVVAVAASHEDSLSAESLSDRARRFSRAGIERRAVKLRVRDVHWKFASRLPLELRRHYLYAAGTGRWGRFDEPANYGEKMQWRIINDRRPELARACDKMAMQERASEDELKIPRTLWWGTDLRDAPDLAALGPWVRKPNHSSGAVLFGPPAPEDVYERTEGWLGAGWDASSSGAPLPSPNRLSVVQE